MFVHLNVHSEYSIFDGIIRIHELVDKAYSLEQGAVALTDTMNLYGSVKFVQACYKKKLYPILGADLVVHSDGASPYTITALCMNKDGYGNLCKLLSLGYETPHYGMITATQLYSYVQGIYLLVNPVTQANDYFSEKDEIAIKTLASDQLAIGLSPVAGSLTKPIHQKIITMAAKQSLPLVALNNVRFLDKHQYLVHETKVCIQDNLKLDEYLKTPKYHENQYLGSSAEMKVVFQQFPEAYENTKRVLARCNYFLEKITTHQLPTIIHEPYSSSSEQLDTESKNNLDAFLDKYPDLDRNVYQERLEYELRVIAKFNLASYYLIVHDFISWAKSKHIMVGPGRGSGVGSLVAFCLGITMLDPIRYNLLFERFLNPDRKSLPDFDIDFCQENRDKVISYLYDQYKNLQTAQIITFGAMKAKGVLRDVGRVFNFSYGMVDSLTRLIPQQIDITLTIAMEKSADFKSLVESSSDYRRLFDRACELEGLARTISKHAGGVVIAPQPLTTYIPLYSEESHYQPVTQLDKDDLEYLGLVKFDLLGLAMLSTIDKTIISINKVQEEPLDIHTIDLDDPDVFEILRQGKTLGVFQLEGKPITAKLVQLQPETIDEVIALIALHRPGPIEANMVDMFIDRKMGRSAVTFAHPDLEPIFGDTYGVFVYQEQIQRLASELANFSSTESEQLRKGISKKKEDILAALKQRFVKNLGERLESTKLATDIYNDVKEFAGYSFNRSHAAAYGILTYQTAWLKTYHRMEFITAYLNTELVNNEKLVKLLFEKEIKDIILEKPSINHSEYFFKIHKPDSIWYGLGGLRGMGKQACDAMTAEREQGPFTSFSNFMKRINVNQVSKKTIEILIAAGAFDAFGYKRKELFQQLPAYLSFAQTEQQQQHLKQSSLFGTTDSETTEVSSLKDGEEFSFEELAKHEYSVFGYYYQHHPLTQYRALARATKLAEVDRLNEISSESFFCMARLIDFRSFISRAKYQSGAQPTERFLITLEGRSSRIEMFAVRKSFGDLHPNKLKGNIVVLELKRKKRKNQDVVFEPISVMTLELWCQKLTKLEFSISPQHDEWKTLFQSVQKLCTKKNIGQKPGSTYIHITLNQQKDKYLFKFNDAFDGDPKHLNEVCEIIEST